MAQLVTDPASRTRQEREGPANPDVGASADGALDRLSRLAATLLHAPLARVHLGRRGSLELRSSFPRTATGSREEALCLTVAGEVVRTGRPVALSRAEDDERLAEPRDASRVNSALGVPLIGPRGRIIGALSVADLDVREWTPEEMENVADLAIAGMAEVGLLLNDHYRHDQSLNEAAASSSRPRLRPTRDRAAPPAADPDLSDASLVTDAGGVIRRVNQAAAELLGLASPALLDIPLVQVIAGLTSSQVREELRELQVSGGAKQLLFPMAARGGRINFGGCTVFAAPGPDQARFHWVFRAEGGSARTVWPPAGSPPIPGVAEVVELERKAPARADADPRIVRLEQSDRENGTDLVEVIRQRLVGALHLGALKAGDRLPSIRETARAFSVTPYSVLQTYAELEVEGLVERRERSGVFVADFQVATPTGLPETGAWLTDVLTQACQHQVKIPHLPDLIRRWTSAVRVRCACVESCVDSRIALALEVSQQFGIEATEVPLQGQRKALREADVAITTAYHAAEVGSLAAELGKPLLIATISRSILSAALQHLRERDLTVVCVDRAYGERLRSLNGGSYRDRVRVITVDDTGALADLDRAEPVLLTPAARQRLQQPDFRLIAPMYPSYSLEFARKVAETLVRLNLQGARA